MVPALARAQGTLTIVGEPSSPVLAGQPFSLNVEVRDQNGQLDTGYNPNLSLSLLDGPGTLQGTTSRKIDADGIARFSGLSITQGGTYRIAVSGGPATPDTTGTIVVQSPSGATSTIDAAPTSITANGTSTATITVTLRDASGGAITTGGSNVQLSTTAGSLGAVTDNGNGTYTATLTSAASPGDATISGTVNGDAIADTATVTFTDTGIATRLEFDQQPTDAVAGTAIAPPVTVRAVLGTTGFTNVLFNGNVTIAIANNPGGGTLSGTTTVAAVNGVATFSNLSINRAGAGYTLSANSGTLSGATSSSFSITPGPASGATTQITAAPTSIPADGSSTSTITIEVQDALGNVRTGGGDTVTLQTTAGSLGPVASQGNGVYTATLTAPMSAGGATISGSVNGNPIIDTASVTFTAVPTQLLFFQQPTNAQAGAAISPPVTVRAADGSGTTVTSFTGNVTIAIGTNPGGGTLSGTTTVAAVNGVATFSNLSINRVGAGYTLSASSGTLSGATSAAFSITPGPASGATTQITAAPTSIPANGSSTSTITVEVQDALGNVRTGGGDVVTLQTTAGVLGPVSPQGNGRYTAVLASPTSAGSATISGSVNGNPITDTASVTFTAVATRLVFGQQPTNVQAGASISPPVTVRAVDNAGTTITGFTGNVTLTIGTNPGGGTLSGTTTVAAVNGVATFPNLSINGAGNGYTLVASTSGLAGATSSTFNVTAATPSAATSTIVASPTAVPADGASTSTITVELRDALGNRIMSGGATVQLFTTLGSMGAVTDLGNGTYTARLTAPSSEGTATVTGRVNGANIVDNATVTFTMVAPNTLRLAFVQAPTNTQAGSPIAPPVSLRVIDLSGATVTSFTGQVTIAIGSNPAGGTLSGSTTVVAIAGVATFPNLSINRAGVGYRLSAGASGITGVTSDVFNVTPGPASTATTQITATPLSIPADGTSISTITVEVRDAFGNPRTTGGDPVGISTTAGTLSAPTDRGNGTYTATLRSSTPGTATITGTIGQVPIVDTATVAFTGGGGPTPATRLVFAQQPGNTQAGTAFSPPVTVRAVNAGGALDPTFTGAVTLAIGTNPSGGALSGTTTVNAIAGIATFPNLSINATGTGYTLTANASGLTGATSNPFSILATTPPTSTDLSVTASVDDGNPAVGDTVTMTIRVTNAGPVTATGVAVDYELSSRLAFVSSVPTQGSYDPVQGVWTVGTLESGEGATLVIEARVAR